MADKVTYGYTRDVNVSPSMWSSNKDFIIKWANDDNPAKRPFFIVRRTEVFDVVDIVGEKEYTDGLNGRSDWYHGQAGIGKGR